MKPSEPIVEEQVAGRRRHRGRLFRRYFLLILALVCGTLVLSGAIGLYFSYQENESALASGEQLAVSRLAMDRIRSGRDWSRQPAFLETKPGETWFGKVYFRKETEPYLSMAVRSHEAGPVTVSEANLKFIWDVVTRIRVGEQGAIRGDERKFKQIVLNLLSNAVKFTPDGGRVGLALTRRFVELHAGEIRLESAPGKGSTFTVTLPHRL